MDASDFEGWVEYFKRDAKQQREAATEALAGPKARDTPRPKPETESGGGDLRAIYDRAFAAAGISVAGEAENVCAGCGKPLGNDRIEKGSQRWHPACFKPF